MDDIRKKPRAQWTDIILSAFTVYLLVSLYQLNDLVVFLIGTTLTLTSIVYALSSCFVLDLTLLSIAAFFKPYKIMRWRLTVLAVVNLPLTVLSVGLGATLAPTFIPLTLLSSAFISIAVLLLYHKELRFYFAVCEQNLWRC